MSKIKKTLLGERSKEDGPYKKLLEVFASGARQRKKYGILWLELATIGKQAAEGT